MAFKDNEIVTKERMVEVISSGNPYVIYSYVVKASCQKKNEELHQFLGDAEFPDVKMCGVNIKDVIYSIFGGFYADVSINVLSVAYQNLPFYKRLYKMFGVDDRVELFIKTLDFIYLGINIVEEDHREALDSLIFWEVTKETANKARKYLGNISLDLFEKCVKVGFFPDGVYTENEKRILLTNPIERAYRCGFDITLGVPPCETIIKRLREGWQDEEPLGVDEKGIEKNRYGYFDRVYYYDGGKKECLLRKNPKPQNDNEIHAEVLRMRFKIAKKHNLPKCSTVFDLLNFNE